jgi:hypothetical protein
MTKGAQKQHLKPHFLQPHRQKAPQPQLRLIATPTYSDLLRPTLTYSDLLRPTQTYSDLLRPTQTYHRRISFRGVGHRMSE